MSQISQQTLADKLQISRATVSRCFTNHPGINPSTRAKVFELAARLGYLHMEMRVPGDERPAQRTRLGLLICADAEEFNRTNYDSPVQALLEGTSEAGLLQEFTTEVRYVDPAAQTLGHPTYREIEPLRKRQWDGVLLIHPFPQAVTEHLLLQYPVVSLVEQCGQSELNTVDVDHYKGIAAVINHLRDLGHRHIGFFSRPYQLGAGWSNRRFGAYMEKITRLGWQYRQEDVVNVNPSRPITIEESYDRARDRVAKGVTAWVCATDHQAYDLIDGLARRGLSVPGDVSVTGFDGIRTPPGRLPLTTMEIPYREIGMAGARRLLELIQKRFVMPQHILIGSRFRAGRTTGRAPLKPGRNKRRA